MNIHPKHIRFLPAYSILMRPNDLQPRLANAGFTQKKKTLVTSKVSLNENSAILEGRIKR